MRQVILFTFAMFLTFFCEAATSSKLHAKGEDVIVDLLKALEPFGQYHSGKSALYAACFSNCSKDHCEVSEKVREACSSICPADTTSRCIR